MQHIAHNKYSYIFYLYGLQNKYNKNKLERTQQSLRSFEIGWENVYRVCIDNMMDLNQM